jgi:hypothetical protein
MSASKKTERKRLYNFRLAPDLARKFEKTKDKNGVGATEMFELILKFYLSLDPFVWEFLGGLARQSGLPLSRLSEAFILQELSREEAFNKVYNEPSPTFVLPFTGQNIMLRGEALAESLTKQWEEIFQTVKQALEENPGLPISEMAEMVKEAHIH